MKELLRSFSAAWSGFRHAVGEQRNIRIHIGAALLVIVLGIYLDVAATDWALITLAIGLVLVAELFNTAIETVVDLIEPRLHPLAGKAKDIAAGAVLATALIAVVIAGFVFYKYLAAQ
jgi:diacylglycerol kinase (ATP)